MNADDLGFSYDLPIFDRRLDIVTAVDTNQVTIVTAETGAGKSTQVPQYLAEHGYRKVIVDSRGRIQDENETVPPQPGQDLVTTIDLDLQRAAYAAVTKQLAALDKIQSRRFEPGTLQAALVAMNARTGIA